MDDLANRLAAAKLWLVSPRTNADDGPRGLPYLAHAVYALTSIPTTDVPKMTADERWRIYVNPVWASQTPIPELGRELAHLVWHLLLDHANRARAVGVTKTTARPWRQACDIVIRDTLSSADACPDHVENDTIVTRCNHPGTRRAGQSAEAYWATLSGLPASPPPPPDDADDHDDGSHDEDCGSACDGIPRNTDMPADADIGGLNQFGAYMIRKRVAVDYQEHAKSRGDRPGEALRWARNLTDPVVAWEPLLARAVRRAVGWAAGREHMTWSRPSRRQSVTPQFPQAGWRRPLPAVAVVVDTSGSVDDQLLGKAMSEVDGALRGLGVPGASIAMYTCDAAVAVIGRIRKASDATLIGGGGTDMRVGIKAASEAKPRPDLIVVFTDGDTPWPETPPPGSAVIAAMLRRPDETVPPPPAWTTRIDCVLDG